MARNRTLALAFAAAAGCSQPAPPPAPTPKPVAAEPAEPPKPAEPEKPAEPAPKYSLAQYEKLKLGATEDEVKAVMGEPSARPDNTGWSYVDVVGTGVRSIFVQFDGGKVISKGMSGFATLDPGRLTKANVAKVKVGMTEKEVVELLGPGDRAEAIDGTALSYNHDGKAVLVVFADGKVSKEPTPVGFD